MTRWNKDEGRAHADRKKRGLDFLFRLKHLPAAILARLKVDMMRAAQFAGILVLDIGRRRERIGGTAEAALHGRHFSLGDCHFEPNSR
jgi:hypothetical protein